ncbi:MAG: hypothetical protein EBW55_02840, partial [Betaproteobacteria bacterium]|nr:hypothetical protein [Betaproteobacteria bacterium]
RLIDRIDRSDKAAISARLAAIDAFSNRFVDVLILGTLPGLYYLQYRRFGVKVLAAYPSKREVLVAYHEHRVLAGVEEIHWLRFLGDQSQATIPYLYRDKAEGAAYQDFDKDLTNAVLAADWFCKSYGTEEQRIAADALIDARLYHAMRRRGLLDESREPAPSDAAQQTGWAWLWQAWELSQVLYELGIAAKIDDWSFSERSGNPFRQPSPDYLITADDHWRFEKTLELLTQLVKASVGGRTYTVEDFDISLIGRFRQFLPNLEARERFLDEMYRLGAHAVYPPETMAAVLNSCDISCQVSDWSVIVFDDIEIRITEPEWGKSGIYASDVVLAAIKRYGYAIDSKMTGRGFRHRDLLSKLAAKWGVKRDFV